MYNESYPALCYFLINSMESVALRLITGLGNSEVMPSLSRCTLTDTKPTLISTDSEELNRVLVLTMARAIHVTGLDIKCCPQKISSHCKVQGKCVWIIIAHNTLRHVTSCIHNGMVDND